MNRMNFENNHQNYKTYLIRSLRTLTFSINPTTMKKFSLVFASCILLSLSPVNQNLQAAKFEKPKSETKLVNTYEELVARVFEIKSLDRAQMSETEREELKLELRVIKNDLKGIKKANAASGVGPKVYISLGTVLLVVLILLIVL